jgi:hypothetical protein
VALGEQDQMWINLTIEQTAYKVADIVCKRYEATSLLQLHMHASDCSGRRLGKTFFWFAAIVAVAVIGLVVGKIF